MNVYIGLDVSLASTAICVVSTQSKVVGCKYTDLAV